MAQEVERLRAVAAETEKRLAAQARRVAELEALCTARHAGLQIVLEQLHAAEQRADEAEQRARAGAATPRAGGWRRARAMARLRGAGS